MGIFKCGREIAPRAGAEALHAEAPDHCLDKPQQKLGTAPYTKQIQHKDSTHFFYIEKTHMFFYLEKRHYQYVLAEW